MQQMTRRQYLRSLMVSSALQEPGLQHGGQVSVQACALNGYDYPSVTCLMLTNVYPESFVRNIHCPRCCPCRNHSVHDMGLSSINRENRTCSAHTIKEQEARGGLE